MTLYAIGIDQPRLHRQKSPAARFTCTGINAMDDALQTGNPARWLERWYRTNDIATHLYTAPKAAIPCPNSQTLIIRRAA